MSDWAQSWQYCCEILRSVGRSKAAAAVPKHYERSSGTKTGRNSSPVSSMRMAANFSNNWLFICLLNSRQVNWLCWQAIQYVATERQEADNMKHPIVFQFNYLAKNSTSLQPR